MPASYIKYLDALPHYRITTFRQRIGRAFYLVTWMPGLLLFFSLVAKFSDKHGNVPLWAKKLRAGLFRTMWLTYDWFGSWMFGNAEETIGGDNATLEAPVEEART